MNTWPTSPYRVIGLAVTPDGKYIVAISWRPAEAGPQQSSSGSGATSSSSRNSSQSYGSESASPSPGGAASTSRSIGLERSKIHFWDVQQKREVGSINMIEEMVSVTVSDDSRYVLINQRPNEAHVWDIATRTHVFTYKGHRLNNNMARCCFGGSEQSFIVSGSEGEFRPVAKASMSSTLLNKSCVASSSRRLLHLHLPPHHRPAARAAHGPRTRRGQHRRVAPHAALSLCIMQRRRHGPDLAAWQWQCGRGPGTQSIPAVAPAAGQRGHGRLVAR